MTVWTVQLRSDWEECFTLVKVFATEAAARTYVDAHSVNAPFKTFNVEEQEVFF